MIRTTHVGSLPRPENLGAELTALDRGTLSEVEREALPAEVRRGVRESMARQLDAGLDVVNDGEAGKYGYATYVKQRLSGLDGPDVPLALADLADYPTFTMSVALEVTNPACTGPVSYRGHDALRTDIENLLAAQAETGATEVFMNAASPGIIADYQVNRYYPDNESYLYALADAMKQEYDAITRAGIVLQLDCPDFALGRHLAATPLSVPEFRTQLRSRVEVLNHATRDIDPEMMRFHVCWGNYESPHHHDVPLHEILDLLLLARPSTMLFEAANPRHEHEWRVFADVELPEGKRICPGVVDTLTSYVEHPELVADRICRYAELVGPQRVLAGTDCGFATFANFVHIHPEIVWAKLRSLTEGARLAGERLRTVAAPG